MFADIEGNSFEMRSLIYCLLAAMLVAVCALSGCDMLGQIVGEDAWKSWEPSSTSLQVQSDGILIETIFDTLDQSYYEGNELEDMIARSIYEYNNEHEADSILVTDYSDTQGDVQVTICYKTGDDYAQYNNLVFFDGPMLEAEIEGFLFAGNFFKIEGDSKVGDEIGPEEPLSHKEYSVTIVEDAYVVQVPGFIRYISTNAEIVNSHVAQMSEDDEEDFQDSFSVDSAHNQDGSLSALVGEEELSAKEKDLTYLYVIYEED